MVTRPKILPCDLNSTVTRSPVKTQFELRVSLRFFVCGCRFLSLMLLTDCHVAASAYSGKVARGTEDKVLAIEAPN